MRHSEAEPPLPRHPNVTREDERSILLRSLKEPAMIVICDRAGLCVTRPILVPTERVCLEAIHALTTSTSAGR